MCSNIRTLFIFVTNILKLFNNLNTLSQLILCVVLIKIYNKYSTLAKNLEGSSDDLSIKVVE